MQLRRGGTVLAGLAGAGVGVTCGLAWREFERGETEIGAAILSLALLISALMLFVVLHARVIAQLIELRAERRDTDDLERRLLALELELSARSAEDDPAEEDLSAH